MGPGRGRPELGREGEVAPLDAAPAARDLPRHAAVQDLRRSRLLTPSEAKAALVAAAAALGFDAVAVTTPTVSAQARDALHRFLHDGGHGDMAWLAAQPERRSD